MSTGLPLNLSTALVSVAAGCSWAQPGANPYKGDPARALADFDLPEDARRKLRTMLQAHRPTEVVTITRDDIVGEHRYADLRDMHSGGGRVCHGPVDRSAWRADHRERALVYCADDACVILPTICNNISRVSRRPDETATEDSPLDIEPAAGPPGRSGPTASPLLTFAPPLDGLPPSDILDALPGAPGGPGDGSLLPPIDGRPVVGGPDAGAPIDAGPIGGVPIGGSPIVGIPIGGIVPPCCGPEPIGRGAPLMPPVPPPIASVPEPSAAWLMLAGCALLATACRRARRNPAF